MKYTQVLKEHIEENLNEIIEPVTAFLALAGLTSIWAVLRRSYKEDYQKCKNVKGKWARELCMATVRKKEAMKKIGVLSKARGSCHKSKNPAKCTKHIDANISKLKNQATKMNARIAQAKAKSK